MLSSLLYTCLSLASVKLVNAQWPTDSNSAIVREIEHLYLDSATHNLQSFISPCSQYVDSSTGSVDNSLGRQTAAEWVRVAFHDFVTYNIYTESGGVDASIGFETTRGENVGTAFNDALINFSYFFNAKVSMSDLIALSVVVTAGHCGGTSVSMRGGRIDATAAGPTGVPQPQQDLHTQLVEFSNAGFNQDDTIALTACGHSFGGVHRNIFPDVIQPGTTGTQEGSDGRIAFDSTSDTLDTTVINEYLQGTGNAGGPLVTTTNVTDQSDLRLYSSDSNSTVKNLAQSQSYFQSQCSALFQRMIETAPGSVRFTNPINPTSTTNLKPYDVDLSVDWDGNMVLNGYLRYVQVSGAATAPDSYTVALVDRSGTTTSTTATATKSDTDTGTGLFGATNSYQFTLNFDSATGLSGITAGGQTFAFQDTMFVIPGLTSLSPFPPPFSATPAMDDTGDYTSNVTVAVSSILELSHLDLTLMNLTVPLHLRPRLPHRDIFHAYNPNWQCGPQDRCLNHRHSGADRRLGSLHNLLWLDNQELERQAGVRDEH